MPTSFAIAQAVLRLSPLIITTNKPFDKWGDIFSDHTMASAILDRVVHHSVVIQINGPSYRAKDLKIKGGEG
mgnify:CR=1 FL=1